VAADPFPLLHARGSTVMTSSDSGRILRWYRASPQGAPVPHDPSTGTASSEIRNERFSA
jgi:hypothetical protein